MQKTLLQRWKKYKKKNLKIVNIIWFWKNFSKFLFDLMKNSENKRLVAIQKYDFAWQKQSQNMNNFVVYFKMLENDLNKFIFVQKKLFSILFKKRR